MSGTLRAKAKAGGRSEPPYRSKLGSRKRQPHGRVGGRRGEHFDFRAYWQRVEREYFQRVGPADIAARARPSHTSAGGRLFITPARHTGSFLLDYSDAVAKIARSLTRLHHQPPERTDFIKLHYPFFDYANGDDSEHAPPVPLECFGYRLTPTSCDIPDVEKDRRLELQLKDTPITDELRSLGKLHDLLRLQNSRRL